MDRRGRILHSAKSDCRVDVQNVACFPIKKQQLHVCMCVCITGLSAREVEQIALPKDQNPKGCCVSKKLSQTSLAVVAF